MSVIFQKEPRTTGISDQTTIHGYTFDAQLVASEVSGNAAAIHYGRILTLQVTCEDEIIAFYDDGQWYQPPDESFEEGVLAVDIFVHRWSNYEMVRRELEVNNSGN